MSSEFFRRRAAFDDLGHRIGLGLCIVIAAATVILLVLTFDPRYDLAHQAAALLGAVIFAATLGLFSYVSARAIMRLAHRLKYGSAKDQLGWRSRLDPRELTDNARALLSGAALGAAALLFRLIAEIATGFPQGGVYAIGRLAAAGLAFLLIGYGLARAVLWALSKHNSSGPGGFGR